MGHAYRASGPESGEALALARQKPLTLATIACCWKNIWCAPQIYRSAPLGDLHGNVVHLFDREIDSAELKVIEEGSKSEPVRQHYLIAPFVWVNTSAIAVQARWNYSMPTASKRISSK